jgi:uncharacterized membrane protein
MIQMIIFKFQCSNLKFFIVNFHFPEFCQITIYVMFKLFNLSSHILNFYLIHLFFSLIIIVLAILFLIYMVKLQLFILTRKLRGSPIILNEDLCSLDIPFQSYFY